MAVTIIETSDGTIPLMRVYEHGCSLGEFTHKLELKLMMAITRRMSEGKERFNLHDIIDEAIEELGKVEPIGTASWQKLNTAFLVPPDILAYIRSYNFEPKPLLKVKDKKEE